MELLEFPADTLNSGGRNLVVEVLELALCDDIYLVTGVRDSKGEAGEPSR
jgi:hypothetical protein